MSVHVQHRMTDLSTIAPATLDRCLAMVEARGWWRERVKRYARMLYLLAERCRIGGDADGYAIYRVEADVWNCMIAPVIHRRPLAAAPRRED